MDNSRTDYGTILIDPPWPERGSGKIKRGADRHYDLLTRKEDILRVIVQSPSWTPADVSHLYLWTTNTYLPWGLWLMDALGYRYTTNIAWVKRGRPGLGQWFRGRHELLLFGVKGRAFTSLRTDRRDLDGVVDAPRRGHSVKPQASIDLIEARSLGPYLEMFARERRPGWDAWGHEAPTTGKTGS